MKSDKKILNEIVELNLKIHKNNLTLLNFGNASYIDRKNNLMYIKGSGFYTSKINTKNISVLKLAKNKLIQMNKIKQSVDSIIHYIIYKNLKKIKFIAHTHSTFATILAQSEIEPECTGTTHADYFFNKIPLSKRLKIFNNNNYEEKLGISILERLKKEKHQPPGMLIRNHGLIAWGKTSNETIENLIAIEKICELYYYSRIIKKNKKIPKNLHNLHYFRKHGKKKTYGQN